MVNYHYHHCHQVSWTHNFRDAHVTTATSTPTSTASSYEEKLATLAQEAERLCELSRRTQQQQQQSGPATVAPQPPTRASLILPIANQFLILTGTTAATPPPPPLPMQHPNHYDDLSKIHRAFLHFIQATLPYDIDCSLMLAQRCVVDWSLPLYLPLYQQLIQHIVVPKRSHDNKKAQVIFQVLAWTIHPERAASTSTTAEGEKITAGHTLQLPPFSLISSTLILLASTNSIEELHQLLSSLAQEYPLHLYLEDSSNRNAISSILNILRDNLRHSLTTQHSQQEALHETIASIVEIVHLAFVTGDDGESLLDDDDDERTVLEDDPLDRVVESIMIKRIHNTRHRFILSQYLRLTRPGRNSTDSDAPPPSEVSFRVEAFDNHFVVTENPYLHPWYDFSSDEDEYSLANPCPDIAHQLIELSEGKPIRLTAEFKDYIYGMEPAFVEYHHEESSDSDHDDDGHD